MSLVLFFITNSPDVAMIADKYGVDRVWIDLEVLGKEERQKGFNTVKSHHRIEDIGMIKPLLKNSQLLVRINSWYSGSVAEIEAVIREGADIIMLPFWKTLEEVKYFLEAVRHRAKTSLLLETKEAVNCIDEVLELEFDEIHIGLNDLSLSYNINFMFELLTNGTVEMLCNKFNKKGIPYGFGGIAKVTDGLIPASKIIMEHYRLGSSRAILSRTFIDTSLVDDLNKIDSLFKTNMDELRKYEQKISTCKNEDYISNKEDIRESVSRIVENLNKEK